MGTFGETVARSPTYPLLRRNNRVGSVLKVCALTYALTGACLLAAIAISNGTASAVPALTAGRGLLLLLGTFARSSVALGVTARDNGTPATQALLRRAFEWRVDARWYLFAVSYMAAIKLAVALAHRAITGSWPLFGNEAWYVIVIAIVLSTPVQAGEEIGWRGRPPPRLAGPLVFVTRTPIV